MNRIPAAHIREDKTIQSISDHVTGTAKLAKLFADRFSAGTHAYLCGLLHDIGKYSDSFQRRIYEGGERVDHSSAGAQVLKERFEEIGFLLAYCVAGHHGGLPDGGSLIDAPDEPTLNGRLKRKLDVFERFKADIKFNAHTADMMLPIRPIGNIGFSLSFFIRMLFSCLVDGDRLDTECFMQNGKSRVHFDTIGGLSFKLDRFLSGFADSGKKINQKRSEILRCCIDNSEGARGLYTLTVPTGGGKTISSMAFALKHAKRHNMDRVIYVIPYNSIIEQNAAVFKHILGDENVLEHHSNFSYDNSKDNIDRHRLAAENWDMPVIVTTTVQFFESLFSNKPSKCRKLHNIANSVVIFDEAQMFPVPYLIPCIRAIADLVYNYRITAVLCSATQPALGDFFPKELMIRELCGNTEELTAFFKATQIAYLGETKDQELAGRLNDEKQVLCIVNTRKQAQNLFRLLDAEGAYHLSTFMYPRHRKWVLKRIRRRLLEGLPCRVVSTSLIEAGVDVDFPVVYRAEAGLDSVIQAAGRCNRERMRVSGPVYVFRPEMEYRKHTPSMLKRPQEIARSIAAQFEDISSLEAISAYFTQLYKSEGGGLDEKNIVRDLECGYENGLSFPFAKVAEEFNLIENTTYSIIIPANYDARELIGRLKNGERSRELLRRIQQFAVNVYSCNYNVLYGSGSIMPLDENAQLAVLVDRGRYNIKTGLDASADMGVGVFV